MKIVIVGGGISGLALYIALQKHLGKRHGSEQPLEVFIYETYDASRRQPRVGSVGEGQDEHLRLVSEAVGGALGVSPNGMRVLGDLHKDLYQAVASHGYPVSTFRIHNAYGWALGRFSAANKSNPSQETFLISRQGLWNCLRDRVPDHVVIRKTVSAVKCCKNQRPRVLFADDSPDEEADLVLGADGVRSVAKSAVLGDQGEDSRYSAVYEGLVGVGGFIPSSLVHQEQCPRQITMTFGSQGFFGYGACSQSSHPNSGGEDCVAGPEAVWWSTYSVQPLPDTKGFDRDDIHRQLRVRHSSWNDTVIQKIVANASIDSIYPTWTTPELPTWEREGVVLVGDAAHALQPSSGQGASQALEDADVLSILLSHYLAKVRQGDSSESATPRQEAIEDGVDASHSKQPPPKPVGEHSPRVPPVIQSQAIALASKAYFCLRAPRVKRIRDRAKYGGDMKRKKGFIGEWITYLFIWFFGGLAEPLCCIAKFPDTRYTDFVFGYSCMREVERYLESQGEKYAGGSSEV